MSGDLLLQACSRSLETLAKSTHLYSLFLKLDGCLLIYPVNVWENYCNICESHQNQSTSVAGD